jgi:hypothetical protein
VFFTYFAQVVCEPAARRSGDSFHVFLVLLAALVVLEVVLQVAIALHLDAGRWMMAHVILFGVVLAELTRFGAQIAYHRRGF